MQALMLVLFMTQGAKKQLYNCSPAIRERAIEKGITTQEEMDVNAKRNKIMGSLVMVVDTIWFCHSKWWIIPGTEDMEEAYHDYAFHWKWFSLGC